MIIANITGEGFNSEIHRHVNSDKEIVVFRADADIDADGANGQSGARAAYRADDKGSELLANGGMGRRNGKVIFIKPWGPDIAVVDNFGHPLVIDGIVITKTAYKYPSLLESDPAAWVDAETVSYIAIPKVIIKRTEGIVKGCYAIVKFGAKEVPAVVADIGPSTKIGEISIQCARLLGIPSDPRHGGLSNPDVIYTIFPGVSAAGVVPGFSGPLIRG